MTAAVDIPLKPPPGLPQHIVLDGMTWDFYEHLLRLVGDRPIQITFFRGRLEIMSPLFKRERWKMMIGGMIELLARARKTPFIRAGSLTLRQQDEEAGLEPDQCYYLQHARQVLGKERIDLPGDPPPDLAVEIDITRHSIARQPIYAVLAVPELWRFDGKRLHFLKLVEAGRYDAVDHSLAFPFLSPEDLQPFLDRMHTEDDLAVTEAFEEWLKTLRG